MSLRIKAIVRTKALCERVAVGHGCSIQLNVGVPGASLREGIRDYILVLG